MAVRSERDDARVHEAGFCPGCRRLTIQECDVLHSWTKLNACSFAVQTADICRWNSAMHSRAVAGGALLPSQPPAETRRERDRVAGRGRSFDDSEILCTTECICTCRPTSRRGRPTFYLYESCTFLSLVPKSVISSCRRRVKDRLRSWKEK